MAVAKTYEKMALVGEPFQENGKMYVNVQAPKGQKKVRWYSDAEYRRMYPNAVKNDIMDFNARHAFGFGPEGFITIYQGHNLEDWADAEHDHLRFNCTFGYYTPGRLELPTLTKDIIPIKLTWKEVAAEGNKMKPHEEVHKYVMSHLNPNNDVSQYQGNKDEWLQKDVAVRAKKSADSRYGTKHTYTLADAEGNIYIWETGAKDYPLDATVSLKMKVKEHKEISNEKVTVVWYCKEASK